jgi:hypothetical protein
LLLLLLLLLLPLRLCCLDIWHGGAPVRDQSTLLNKQGWRWQGCSALMLIQTLVLLRVLVLVLVMVLVQGWG